MTINDKTKKNIIGILIILSVLFQIFCLILSFYNERIVSHNSTSMLLSRIGLISELVALIAILCSVHIGYKNDKIGLLIGSCIFAALSRLFRLIPAVYSGYTTEQIVFFSIGTISFISSAILLKMGNTYKLVKRILLINVLLGLALAVYFSLRLFYMNGFFHVALLLSALNNLLSAFLSMSFVLLIYLKYYPKFKRSESPIDVSNK